MYTDPAKIIEKHTGDIPTLWKVYQSDGKFYNNYYFKISVALSFIFLVSLFFTTTNAYDVIQKITDVAFSILPSMLGFNLGAYILIVGFGSSDILEKITKPLKGQNDYSFYQKMNGVMGFSVLVQISALMSSFLIKVWDKIQDGVVLQNPSNCVLVLEKTLNMIILFLILFLVTYSILILVSVIKHVFMFSQTIHFFIYNKRLKESNEEDVDKKNN